MYSDISPSQNTGAEMPNRATPIASRGRPGLCRSSLSVLLRLDRDLRPRGRGAELVELVVRDVVARDAGDGRPHPRHPRNDLRHQVLVELLVARGARIAPLRVDERLA